MLWPPPKSQDADAGGLGLEALSDCADPRRAIIPMARHPAPRNATLLLMVPSSETSANIESNLPFSRNCNCCRPLRRIPPGFVSLGFGACEIGKGAKSAPFSQRPGPACARWNERAATYNDGWAIGSPRKSKGASRRYCQIVRKGLRAQAASGTNRCEFHAFRFFGEEGPAD